jgi:hypothetical protein
MNEPLSILSSQQYTKQRPFVNLVSPLDGVLTDLFVTSHFLSQVEALLELIQNFANLSNNWDQEGAMAPAPVAIQETRRVVVDFVRAQVLPDVMPLSDGGLLIEVANGVAATQIEVSPDGRVAYLISVGGTVTHEGSNRPNVRALLQELARSRARA